MYPPTGADTMTSPITSTASTLELETARVLRNTYLLLSMTLMFSAVTAAISMALCFVITKPFELISYKNKVAKLHVLEAPRNSLVGSVVRLPFREFFDSSCTKLNKCQWHHFECAQEETSAFLCVFIKGEQKKSGKIAGFGGAQTQPCGLCCATPVS